jgi:hypothetical protein
MKHRRKQKTTTFSVGYSEPSTATITVQLRHKCRRHARHCKKFTKFGTLKISKAGTSGKASFKARIGKRKLRLGSYRANIVATDPAGNRSKVKRLTFKVVK